MTELKTKITESGVLYVPKEVRDCFGRETRIITNASAAVMYPSSTDYEDVLVSMGIIEAEVKHRISLRDRARRKLGGEGP